MKLYGLNRLSGVADNPDKPNLAKRKLALGEMSEYELQLQIALEHAELLRATRPDMAQYAMSLERIIDKLATGQGVSSVPNELAGLVQSLTDLRDAGGHTKPAIIKSANEISGFKEYDTHYYAKLYENYKWFMTFWIVTANPQPNYPDGTPYNAKTNDAFFLIQKMYLYQLHNSSIGLSKTNTTYSVTGSSHLPNKTYSILGKVMTLAKFTNLYKTGYGVHVYWKGIHENVDAKTKITYIEDYIHYNYRDGAVQQVAISGSTAPVKKNMALAPLYAITPDTTANKLLSTRGFEKRGLQKSYVNKLVGFSGMSNATIQGLITNSIHDATNYTAADIAKAMQEKDAAKTSGKIGFAWVVLIPLIIAIIGFIQAMIVDAKVGNGNDEMPQDLIDKGEDLNEGLDKLLDDNGTPALCDSAAQNCSDFLLQYNQQQNSTPPPTGTRPPTTPPPTGAGTDSKPNYLLWGLGLGALALYANNNKQA